MRAPPAIQPVTERQFQTAVIQLAHMHHWKVMHVADSRKEIVRQDGARFLVGDKETTGWPDLVLVRERVVFAELKAEKGRLSKPQECWLALLGAAGQEVYVWRPVDFPSIEDVLARRAT